LRTPALNGMEVGWGPGLNLYRLFIFLETVKDRFSLAIIFLFKSSIQKIPKAQI
jgi:hypothetical protein